MSIKVSIYVEQFKSADPNLPNSLYQKYCEKSRERLLPYIAFPSDSIPVRGQYLYLNSGISGETAVYRDNNTVYKARSTFITKPENFSIGVLRRILRLLSV